MHCHLDYYPTITMTMKLSSLRSHSFERGSRRGYIVVILLCFYTYYYYIFEQQFPNAFSLETSFYGNKYTIWYNNQRTPFPKKFQQSKLLLTVELRETLKQIKINDYVSI